MDLDLATLAEGLWPFIMGRLRPRITWYTATNNSGGALAAGDVVAIDSTDEYVTTSTTLGERDIAGIVLIGGANGAVVYVATAGVVTVNVTGAVARGEWLRQSTSAKLAQGDEQGSAGGFGIAVTAAAGPGSGTVKAIISLPARVRVDLVHQIPASVTLNAGSSTDGVADLQTPLDGNVYHVDEAAATPGIDLECNFTGIVRIRSIFVRAYYVGGTTHAIRLQLYNYNTAGYDTIHTLNTGLDVEQFLLELPVIDTNYISAGAAKVRFYHTEMGNASHDMYVDYVALCY